MRKLILGVAITLDGFIEGPNGEYDWCFTDQDYGLTEFSQRTDALFMGRKSYDVSKSYEGESPWSGKTIYVFSRTLQPGAEPGIILVPEVSAQAVQAIKQQPGKDIWLFGGADLTRQLINARLVDELWLSVHPILLGSGTPMFQGIEGRISLRLLEEKKYETGLVSVRYGMS